KRDGGRCTWCGPDGQRCGSTWKVELDHIQPAALGGPSTVGNLRILCRLCRSRHNRHYADRPLMPTCRVEGLSRRRSGVADAA
ncbi:MAG TPA: HNH endonuclease, partial [Anaeromyxobacteraceae bacterium]|nr:HNH endonuclease [Anaeromyxobacteraceae bacterium]